MRPHAVITVAVMSCVLCFCGSLRQNTSRVTLRLAEATTDRELSGLVRITDEAGQPVDVKELLGRETGLKAGVPIAGWRVLPGETTVQLPQGELTIEAISGLETETARQAIDLRGKASAEVSIPLVRFADASSAGYFSGNTHLHLKKLSRPAAERYLEEVPRGDDLDLVFLSSLERVVDDREYISNRYTTADLAALTKRTGIGFGNGEEHRHNLAGYGQGFGHVMLLNIKRLIQPVSIGPGIMKMGTDGIPLRRGIDTARDDGATIVWCHNDWGMEDVPNLVTGRLHAQNIFDGGSHGSYKHSFYRYLNAGYRISFSTGTDWFMYDFSRVYARVGSAPSVESWLDALQTGKTFITNGPLLEFHVERLQPGGTVPLEQAGKVRVRGSASGRADFGRIEVVFNGSVVGSAPSRPVGGHFEASLDCDIDCASPGWLALRTPPPPLEDDPSLQEPVGQNEFGRDLFAHTSPVYVEIAGVSHFDASVAGELLAEMESNQEFISQNANFADSQERERVLDVHRDGIAALKARLDKQASP